MEGPCARFGGSEAPSAQPAWVHQLYAASVGEVPQREVCVDNETWLDEASLNKGTVDHRGQSPVPATTTLSALECVRSVVVFQGDTGAHPEAVGRGASTPSQETGLGTGLGHHRRYDDHS